MPLGSDSSTADKQAKGWRRPAASQRRLAGSLPPTFPPTEKGTEVKEKRRREKKRKNDETGWMKKDDKEITRNSIVREIRKGKKNGAKIKSTQSASPRFPSVPGKNEGKLFFFFYYYSPYLPIYVGNKKLL